jgi:seryl-tRNA synthetase
MITDRAVLALFENFQEADGSVYIPTALQKYMYGQKKITLSR